MQILISDEYHINKRNFGQLYQLFDRKKAELTVFSADWDSNPLNGCVGNYSNLGDAFYTLGLFKYHESIKQTSDEFTNQQLLLQYEYKGINLWNVVKSELAAYTIAEAYKRKIDFPYESSDLFDYHFKFFLEDLISAYSVACYWIDQFEAIEQNAWKCKIAFVFSGSYIYTKVLLARLVKSPVKTFVIESTFKGKSFYCDEQYEHLPNNYLHQYQNCRKQAIDAAMASLQPIGFATSDDKKNYLHSSVLNKFMGMANKNVKQPKPASVPRMKDITKPTVLLICQVVNDFSILESKGVINSIEHYKRVIAEILENTDSNLIIKTHPWEKSKVHLENSVTLLELNTYISTLDERYKSRVYLDEDINLYHLLSNVDSVITFCSQSGLEAPLFGKKVIVNSECSYANSGFTSDYSDVKQIPKLLKNTTDLNIDEFECFLNFMIAFDYMVVDESKADLEKLLSKVGPIVKYLPEYHRPLAETSVTSFFS